MGTQGCKNSAVNDLDPIEPVGDWKEAWEAAKNVQA